MTKIHYDITHIPVEKLSVVWAKAQRPYQEKWAKEIADNFDPDKFEPIIVTKPNGVGIYHIVEGQHRKGAVEMLWGPQEKVPCRVVDHADPARAAEIWLGINQGRKATRPVSTFLIAVEAKREIETAINVIVKRAQYRIGQSAKADNMISAVAALRHVYGHAGEKVLSRTLEICRLLWGSDPQGVSSTMIRGLGLFINEWDDYLDPRRLRHVVQEKYKSPWKLVDAAKTLKEKASEPLDVALAELLRLQYNKSLRDGGKRLVRKDLSPQAE